MVASARLLLFAIATTAACAQPAVQQPTLENCLASIGLPAASSGPGWSANIELTVSDKRDASHITFSPDRGRNLFYLIYTFLPRLRFTATCIGRRIRFQVMWQPSRDGRLAVAVRGGTMTLTSYSVPPPRGHWSGVAEGDLEELSNAPSITEFVKKRKLLLEPDR